MIKKYRMFILEIFLLLVITMINYKIIFAFIFVIIHESSHMVFAKIYGLNINKMKIKINGAKSEISDIDNLCNAKKIIIFLSGPMMNLLLAIIFVFLVNFADMYFLYEAYIINLGLFIFNLIPAYPLDGARILEMILERKMLYKDSKNVVVILSIIISAMLLLLFVFSIYIHKINISFILAPIFITYSTILEGKKTMYMIIKSLYKKENKLVNNSFLENKNISIYYKCSLVKALSIIDRNKYNSFYVLNEGLKVLGIVYEDEIMDAIKNYGNIDFKQYLEEKNKGNI